MPPQPPAPPPGPPQEVQLSFGGANVDVIMRWLAEMTGKSVTKFKAVNCQLTIVSPKKLPTKEAIQLVYKALALEGFSVVETGNVIMIVPEAMEMKAGAELVDGQKDTLTEGRQILVKVLHPQHVQADRLKDKIRLVLSEKGKIEVDDRANKLIITDWADSVRLAQQLLKELDVETASDADTVVIQLQHAQAEELASLLNMVFAEGPPKAGGGGGSPPGGGERPPGPGPSKAQGGTIRVLADKVVNRLIVTAPLEQLPEIKKLITTLDSEKPADVAVRVIPLKHASGRDLVQDLSPMYEKTRGANLSLKDMVEISANARSNSLIVLSSETNFKTIQSLVALLDTEEAQEKTMKAFPLKHADAEDMADQLTNLYRGRDDDYYDYGWSYRRSSSSGGQSPRFVADRRKNSVIVIGPPAAMEKVAEMILALDEPIEGENLTPKIFSLKYVSAIDVEEVLNQLFLKGGRSRTYWDSPYGYGYEDSSGRDVGRLAGKVRIASEPYSNSIIVTSNSSENFAAVEAILKQLDVPSQVGASTLYVQLKYAKAVTISNNINILFAGPGSPPRRALPQEGRGGDGRPQQQRTGPGATSFELEDEVIEESYFPWLGGGGQPEGSRFPGGGSRGSVLRPVSDLVGKVRVVPDLRTNSLMITSNVHFFPQVLKVIEELDVPTPQVLIEAKIVEVSTDAREKIGVRWSPDGKQVFDRDDMDDSVGINTKATDKQTFLGSALADGLESGVLNASVNLDFLVQFLKKTADSRVRAEPRINVADNERGKLFVGSRVPFIANSQFTDVGGRNDSFTYLDVGIILEVTPHVNNKNEVALRVRVESSQIRQGETLLGGAIIDTRNYLTDLTVKSGQTLVLGGILQNEEADIERKVPILGDIPLLGLLFSKTDTVRRDIELMVFLKPTVTQSPEEVQALMEAERQAIPQIQRWEKSLEQKRKEREALESSEGEPEEEKDRDGNGGGPAASGSSSGEGLQVK